MLRRNFMKLSAMAGVATLFPPSSAYAAFAQTKPLRKFIQRLRGLGTGGIPVATKPLLQPYPGVDYYEIAMRDFYDQLHPDLPPTRLYGYGNTADDPTSFRHLGGAIVATRGTPVRIRFTNYLPPTHILPVDQSIPGAELAQNRAVAHLHGGFVPWPSDGGPFHWMGAEGSVDRGPSVVDWLPDQNGNLTNDTWYPNDQSARLMWYHDHALGITRLNAYAGLASGYVLRDSAEDALVAAGTIPAREMPLVIQDKIFDAFGGLWYPSRYDADFFDLFPGEPVPEPSTVAEFWGDTMLVNGTVYPYVDIEPRRYRLRILNACNTRFVRLRLVYAKGPAFPESTEPDVNALGPAFQQIGTEAGFLPAPVILDGSNQGLALTLAPAERADLIVDFGKTAPGDILLLYNDAPVPFPGGTPLADFYPGNNRLAAPVEPGFGPNTQTLLQFRVGPRSGPAEGKPAKLRLPTSYPALLAPVGVTTAPPGVRVRDLTLNEAIDEFGRLMQLLGTNEPSGPGAFGRGYESAPTERPAVDDIEVWRIFNLSADAHPIHFHLVNVQILSRQPFSAKRYSGVPAFIGAPVPPDPNELGWKETVRMNPGECTTVLMQFKLPPNPVINGRMVEVPFSPRLQDEYGINGHEYVWHCHILEHEEHDMMRPLIVG
jgi:spore coat protein A